jgi:hypothetical protein
MLVLYVKVTDSFEDTEHPIEYPSIYKSFFVGPAVVM